MPKPRDILTYSHLQCGEEPVRLQYSDEDAKVMASFIHKCNTQANKFDFDTKVFDKPNRGYTKALAVWVFAESYSVKKGLNVFGDVSKQAAMNEMKQLHQRGCFRPIRPELLSERELKKTLQSNIFIEHKRCGRVRA